MISWVQFEDEEDTYTERERERGKDLYPLSKGEKELSPAGLGKVNINSIY